ncbi:MAG: alpha/beta fold hydrolase [Pseudomonadota bacterium]
MQSPAFMFDVIHNARPSRLYGKPWRSLWLRPWFDYICLKSVSHWLFPMMRGLAAAQESDSDEVAFQAGTGLAAPLPSRLRDFLADQTLRRRAYLSAASVWEKAAFGGSSVQDLCAAEAGRYQAALSLSRGLGPLVPYLRRLPKLRYDILSPDALAETFPPANPEDDSASYKLPALPEVLQSTAIPGPSARESWLRFVSPELGDFVTARIYEAEDPQHDSPNFIFLHGVGMEPEFWPRQPDAINNLTARGFRVIRPEGPWHGRRRLTGWFGGEPVLARGPLGMLEAFQAWIGEVSVLIRWARRRFAGPVILGGVSMGALTSQRLAVAAANWPTEARPDHLFLVATSESFTDIAFSGALTRELGITRRMQDVAWQESALNPWLLLMEPHGQPIVPPERILMVLGDRDVVTPYAGGLSLANRWRLPPENLFTYNRGHFTLCLGLLANQEPLHRLAAVLGR